MLRSRPIRSLALAAIPLGLMLASSPFASADEHEMNEAQIGYRQKVMASVGANMGAISDILKNRLEVPGAIANHATQMADAAALIAPAFRAEIAEGPTDAKPDIWTDWEGFEQAIAEYEAAARALADAANGDDPAAVGPAMRTLGKSCGGCHRPFRKPKEESFRNQ